MVAGIFITASANHSACNDFTEKSCKKVINLNCSQFLIVKYGL